ncbi:ABC transporter permease [Paenibacillaceae bacterium]|nr:ABC transporter permease [Paenibacillaceae bacterium]
MIPVFVAQWMKERRSPFVVLLFSGLSIAATLMFGMSIDSKVVVPLFSDSNVTSAEEREWLELLNESEAFSFKSVSEHKARANVREARSDFAVRLMKDNYRMIAAIDNPNAKLGEQYINRVFREEFMLRDAGKGTGDEQRFNAEVKQYLKNPPILMQEATTQGEDIQAYDMGLQLLFGFSLFLVVYTIAFKINEVNKEKTAGIWNRVILSPVGKTEMYLGHLLYTSMIGFLQLLAVLLIFQYGFGFELGHFDKIIVIIAFYTLSIVAISMLFTGILRMPEQFSSIISALVPVMPLLSGVYFPPGTISNVFFLGAAQFIPLTHAMDALLGVAMYNKGWTDMFLPMAKLSLIGVISMGVGINLIERPGRH